jgi:hypothetical protein
VTRGRIAKTLRKGLKDNLVAPFHVFPSFVMLIGALIVWWAPHLVVTLPLDTEASVGEYFSGGYDSPSYLAWLGLSIGGPALVILSYWLPTHINHSRAFCLYIRFAGDAAALFALLALDSSTIKIVSDQVLYRQVLFIGYVFFVALMVLRDVYLIVATEVLAGKLEHDKSAEGQD